MLPVVLIFSCLLHQQKYFQDTADILYISEQYKTVYFIPEWIGV